VPIVGQLLELPLEPVKVVEDAAGKSGLAFGMGYLIGGMCLPAAEPLIQPLVHAVADAVHTGIYDPQTAARMVAMGIMPLDAGASDAGGGNYDQHYFNQMVDAAGNRPGLAELLELQRRGILQPGDMETAFARNAIPSYWWPYLEQLTINLLSPADLALAQLRGNMELGPATEYAAKLGVSADDFTTLIDNTGEPPGAEMLMEALRRGFIKPADFDHGIRQSRIRDEWIPTMEDLRYSPMSTADAVRAVVENYIPKEQGAEIADQNGLIAEHWPIMVESLGRPLAHEQMMTLYHRNKATLDEVKQAFRESDLKDKYIDQAVDLGRRLVPERMTVSMLQHGVINSETAHTMLAELGYSQDDADSLIALGTAERTTAHKGLTRTDILAMYQDRLIKKADALDKLVKLGYDTADADEMLDLADYKANAATIRTIKASVEARLKAHDLVAADAIIELTNAGLDHTQATALVDQWTLQKKVATRSLTEAQIIRLAEHQLIAPTDALSRLVSLGLLQSDAKLLLESYIGQF